MSPHEVALSESTAADAARPALVSCTPVRLGFLGLGWIGRSRLATIAGRPDVEVVAVADPSDEARERTLELVPGAVPEEDLSGLLEHELDGVVIATPSALHARQVSTTLRRGVAVYCQKPLARTADETSSLIELARRQDRLLGVDYCYRYVAGVRRMRELIRSGELGTPFSVELTFHNAYGPDKPWFYDPIASGGGCLMDLGTHLIDLALWMHDYPAVTEVQARLYRNAIPLDPELGEVEDAAYAHCVLNDQILVRMGCSWNLSAGCDASIEATFYGSRGAVSLRNIDGSFYDFEARHHRGTTSQRLAGPPDDWGGRSLQRWLKRLAEGGRYEPEAERFLETAAVIDRVYGR